MSKLRVTLEPLDLSEIRRPKRESVQLRTLKLVFVLGVLQLVLDRRLD